MCAGDYRHLIIRYGTGVRAGFARQTGNHAAAQLRQACAFSGRFVLPVIRIDAGAENGLISDMIACSGLDYCNLANTRSLPLADTLFARFGSPEMRQDIGALRLNISGCINACTHHHAADIGVSGVNKKGDEHFQISLGGRAGEDVAVGRTIGPSIAEDPVRDAIAALIEIYRANSQMG